MDAHIPRFCGDFLPVAPAYHPAEQHLSTVPTMFAGALADAFPLSGYPVSRPATQMADMTHFHAAVGRMRPHTDIYDTFDGASPGTDITIHAPSQAASQHPSMLSRGVHNGEEVRNLVQDERKATKPPSGLEKAIRRTRGVDLACTNCRKIKKKCDKHTPCGTCIKYDKADTCVRAERKTRASRGSQVPQHAATQDTSELSAHPMPSAAVPQQATVKPDIRSPEYSTQPTFPSQFSTSFLGVPNTIVNCTMDKSFGTLCRQCGASNPPPEPSRIYEGESWASRTAGPSDHSTSEGSFEACASDGAVVSSGVAPANPLRFRPY